MSTIAPTTSSVTTNVNIFALANDYVFIAPLIVIGSETNAALLGGQGGATVEVYGSIFSAGLEAIILGSGLGDGPGNYNVTIGAGGAAVGAMQGIVLDASGNTLTNDGEVAGQTIGVQSLGDQFKLINAGTITGHTDDAVISTGVGARIINYGSIRSLGDNAAANGVDLSDSDASSVVRLTNYGTISAVGGTAVKGDAGGVDKIENFGVIEGNVGQGGGSDYLRNGGAIIGDADLGAGNDLLKGGGGTVEGIIHAGSGNDTVIGGTSDDTILGEAGNDVLKGGNGDDIITGGPGSDTMAGGHGSDSFVFNQTSESTADSHRDHILDFTAGEDVIDVSGIDAKSGVNGNQAFAFISGAFQHVKGDLHAVNSGANSIVSGDVDGDGKADFSMLVEGVHDLTASDFIL